MGEEHGLQPSRTPTDLTTDRIAKHAMRFATLLPLTFNLEQTAARRVAAEGELYGARNIY